ncbi:Leucine-rich repeat protein 1, partial [Eschrichtius robustus]|nr:Leucine-rich repeat protein 1 [Eschrichtius robustus]
MLSLKNLRKLDLSHNHIKKLPATIGDLIHLQELNLNDNHLESFSVALCQSTLQKSLRSLDLSKNKIKALPIQFCQLQELTDLKLDDNELIQLPFKMGHLTNLRFLSAARNKLPFLPSEFKNLSLEYLDLFGNIFEQPKVLPVIKLQMPLTLLESSARTVLYNR